MIRQNKSAWIETFVISMLVVFFIRVFGYWINIDKFSLSYDMPKNYTVDVPITSTEDVKLTNIYQTKNLSADLIISKEEAEEGYSEFSEMYTPVIMLFPNEITNKQDGSPVIISDYDADFPYTMVDYKIIFEAMAENKTWKDIGIEKTQSEASISLIIPDKKSYWYDIVTNEIFFILNDEKIPTEKEREMLQEKYEAVLSRCEESSDILGDFYSEKEKSSKMTILGSEIHPEKVFLIPELLSFLAKEHNDSYTYSSESNVACYNTGETLGEYVNVFVFDESGINSLGDTSKKDVSDSLMRLTGFRTTGETYGKSYNFIKNEPIKTVPFKKN